MRTSPESKPRFRVLVAHVVYPTDATVIARLQAGERLTPAERGDVLHVAGHVVDDVPECSVPHLLAGKEIEPADDAELFGAGVPVFVRREPPATSNVIDEDIWRDLGRPADDADKGVQ